jgi:pyruvate,orthophosphate dikinase
VARDDRPLQGDVEEELGIPFPQDPHEQLWGAIGAVFGSWMNARAITYRQLHDIPASWGTAVNVQAMVFGNHGRPVRHRRGVHPQSVDRREGTLRRVSRQRPGRGRGRRHPHAAAITEKAARIEAGSDRPSLEKLMPEPLPS